MSAHLRYESVETGAVLNLSRCESVILWGKSYEEKYLLAILGQSTPEEISSAEFVLFSLPLRSSVSICVGRK